MRRGWAEGRGYLRATSDSTSSPEPKPSTPTSRGGDHRPRAPGPHGLTDTPNRGITLAHHPNGLDPTTIASLTPCGDGRTLGDRLGGLRGPGVKDEDIHQLCAQ